MKTIYFVQHGIAQPKDVDPQRPLSAIGRSEVHRVASYLQEHKIVIRKICHSGKLRAQQTASIFAEILKVDAISMLSGMNPKDNPDELIEQITEDAVMYVGHLPHMQHVVTHMVNGAANNSVVKFQNSAVVCIEIDENSDENSAGIKWFITPDIC